MNHFSIRSRPCPFESSDMRGPNPSRSSSMSSNYRLLGTDSECPVLPKRERTSNPAPSLLGRKRFRLPWLDGNNNSSQLPGAFDQDAVESFTQSTVSKDSRPVNERVFTLAPRPNHTVRPFESTPVLSAMTTRKSPKRTRSFSLQDGLRDRSSKNSLSPMPGRWPTVNGQLLQYTPSTYSSTPPSESDMPSHLPRRDPVSYENLVAKPIESPTAGPPRSAMWPMVPLSDTDTPARVSSLSFEEPRRRKDSFLRGSKSAYELRGSSPSSIGRYNDGTISRKPTMRASATQARLDRAATARTLKSPEVSPKSGAPPLLAPPTSNPSAYQDSRSLERAVTGLQDLMHEALSVAAEAAHSNQTHEVAEILNEATLALRKANTVQGKMTAPLRISDPELGRAGSSDDYMSGSDSEAYSDSETSSIASRHNGSDETVPTNYTKSRSAISVNPAMLPFATGSVPMPLVESPNKSLHPGDSVFHPADSRQPTVNPPYSCNGRRPESEHGALDANYPSDIQASSSGDKSIGRTPPAMYHAPSADSVVTDWAYVKRVPGRRELRNGSAARRKPEDSSDNETVIAPAPIRVPTNDQLKFLSRNGQTSARQVDTVSHDKGISLPEVPRERIPRQIRPPVQSPTIDPPRAPSPEHYRISNQAPRDRHGQHVSRLFESSYYHTPDKQRDGFGGQDSREIRYGASSGVKSPDISLRHPRRNHVSLRDDQAFRLHRYRRQPVAREWSTIRKRVTAAIACLNTALIGLIVGIYVSHRLCNLLGNCTDSKRLARFPRYSTSWAMSIIE